jgi:hypothetical protein
MKKQVTKTTREFTYNEEGYLMQEVTTVEEYELDTTVTVAKVKGDSITSDKTTSQPWQKTTGKPPYTATFGTDGLYIQGGDIKLPENTIRAIIEQVQAELANDFARKEKLKGDKAF